MSEVQRATQRETARAAKESALAGKELEDKGKGEKGARPSRQGNAKREHDASVDALIKVVEVEGSD